MNRICLFYVTVVDRQTDCSRTSYKALSFAVSKARKEGFVLKPEQLQAVHHIYEGRDVFLWLPTTFGKSICHEVLPFLLDCKLGSLKAAL